MKNPILINWHYQKLCIVQSPDQIQIGKHKKNDFVWKKLQYEDTIASRPTSGIVYYLNDREGSNPQGKEEGGNSHGNW